MPVPCGTWDLSSPTRIKPTCPALEVQSLNHWTAYNSSFSVSDFVDLSPLPFFLDESGLRFTSVVYLFKELAFRFIDLSYCFLRFCFTYFHSDLFDFFLSTNFRFCLSFSL